MRAATTSKDDQPTTLNKLIYIDCFPVSLVATLCLLRRRVRLSRELADEVVRARGYVTRGFGLYSNIVGKVPFFDDRLHGVTVWKDANGTVMMKYRHIDGIRQGFHRWWHTNGTLQGKVLYVDGKRQGPQPYWNEDGALQYVTHWVDDEERFSSS